MGDTLGPACTCELNVDRCVCPRLGAVATACCDLPQAVSCCCKLLVLNYEKLLQVAVAGLSSVCGHHVRIVVYGHANSVGLQVLVFELSVCGFSRETRASPSGASRGLRANGVSLQLTILRKETSGCSLATPRSVGVYHVRADQVGPMCCGRDSAGHSGASIWVDRPTCPYVCR